MMKSYSLSNKTTTASQKALLRNMLNNAAFAIILMEIAGAITNNIDGVITSQFLGSTALAASGMSGICFTIFAIISGVLSAGAQQLCCNEVGRGNVKKANQIFSTVILFALIVSVTIALLGMIFGGKIAVFAGASPADPVLYQHAKAYITGFFFGAPGHIFVAVLIPEVQLEGKNRQITLSIVVLSVADILGDLLNVLVFHGGMFGMGIATSISYYCSALILFLTFLRRESLFKVRFSDLDFHTLPSVFNIGLPRATKRLGNLIRPLIVNRLILLAGGSIAMAAFTVKQNIRYVTESPGVGISSAVLLLISMFLGEKDLTSMKTTVKLSLQYIVVGIGGLAILYFLASPALALLYLDHSSPSYELAVTVLRCHAVSLPFLGFNEFYSSLAQGTGRLKTAHLITLLNKLIYIVLLSFLLCSAFGIIGLCVAIPLSEFLLTVTILLVNGWRNRKNPLRSSIFSFFDDVDKDASSSLEITVTSKEQLADTNEQVQAFCRKRRLDEKTSYYIQLFFEEIILLIINHGFAEKKNPSISLRLYADEDGLILRVKDNCRPFNAAEQKKMYDKSTSSDEYLGIRMIYHLSKKTDYVNTMNINQFLIHL